jgi:hypothetical protein
MDAGAGSAVTNPSSRARIDPRPIASATILGQREITTPPRFAYRAKNSSEYSFVSNIRNTSNDSKVTSAFQSVNGEFEGIDGKGNGDNKETLVVIALLPPSSFRLCSKYPVFQNAEVNFEWFPVKRRLEFPNGPHCGICA